MRSRKKKTNVSKLEKFYSMKEEEIRSRNKKKNVSFVKKTSRRKVDRR